MRNKNRPNNETPTAKPANTNSIRNNISTVKGPPYAE